MTAIEFSEYKREIPIADSEQITTPPEAMRAVVISMAVESWRFGRVFDRLLMKLDAGEQNRYKSQFRWFIKKVEEALEQADMRIVNIEAHR
jgi:menaquinone-dependent protoporphyrinogen IX oxidase